jgi:TRAP-type C4-dicarboxylate transport system permease small subunit
MKRVTRALDLVIQVAASAMVAAIFLLTLGQVVLRYGFGANLPWTAETTQILLVYLVMLVAAYAIGHGGHFGVTNVAARLPERGQEWMGRAHAVMVGGFALVALVYGARLAVSQMGTIVPALGIPVGVTYLALPLGAALTLVYVAAALLARGPVPR